MDDLTRIKGIGPATAKKLRAAGIDSFAALAAAGDGRLAGLDEVSADDEKIASWISEAKALAPPAPPAPPADAGDAGDGAVLNADGGPVADGSGETKTVTATADETSSARSPRAKPDGSRVEAVDTLVVTTRRASRRRAGISFTKGETRLPLDSITTPQLQAIKDDAALDVRLEHAAEE